MRQTNAQLQEFTSRDQVKEFFHSHGHVVNDLSPDIGLDFLVNFLDKGNSTGLQFLIQLKSAQSIASYELINGDISYPLFTKDLIFWEVQANPVLIIIWDITKKIGWYKWIDKIVKDLSLDNPNWRTQKVNQIHLPKNKLLNKSSLGDIRFYLANHFYPIVSKDKEFQIKAEFVFPKTDEGKRKYEEVQRHFAKGDSVEICGNYINKIDFPDWWSRLFGEIDSKNLSLIIGNQKKDIKHPAIINSVSGNNSEGNYYVEFSSVKAGTDESLFESTDINLPIFFQLIVKNVEKTFTLRLTNNTNIGDIMTILNRERFYKNISYGGSIDVNFLKLNRVLSFPIITGDLLPVSNKFLEFLEILIQIQTMYMVNFQSIDFNEVSIEDFENAKLFISILKEGTYKYRMNKFSMSIRRKGIEGLLASGGIPSKVKISIEGEERTIKILSQTINLGNLVRNITGDWNGSNLDLQSWFESAKEDDSYEIGITNVEIVETYNFDKNLSNGLKPFEDK